MQKSKTIRTLVAVGCVASAGCVSTPKARPQPPPEECPPGAAEAHARYGLGYRSVHGALLGTLREGGRHMPVREGAISAEIYGPWGLFPDWTIFSGRLYFGAERVYGRFTKATLPGGETVPVCLQMMTIGIHPPLGVELEAGSTAARPIIHSSVSVQAVERFE